MAELLRTGAALGLETGPFVSIMETGNRHQLAPVEPNEGRIDHVFRRHDDRCRQVLVWEPGDCPELGRGRPRQYRLDAQALIGELVLQRMAERNDVGLARTVHAVERLR